MLSWDSDQYLRFARERTQPAIDLAARIELAAPRRAIDLGCGPGNSTQALARRWPGAEITGLDSSAAMLAAAQRDFPACNWQEGDIAAWRASEPFDVVFSNAALQWVPHHGPLFRQLFTQVAPGGALAVQMPANPDSTPHRLMRELAASPAWRTYFNPPPAEWQVHPIEYYYDTLAPHASIRERFVAAFEARLVPYFPTRVDGRVLFPFRRLFIVAYR